MGKSLPGPPPGDPGSQHWALLQGTLDLSTGPLLQGIPDLSTAAAATLNCVSTWRRSRAQAGAPFRSGAPVCLVNHKLRAVPANMFLAEPSNTIPSALFYEMRSRIWMTMTRCRFGGSADLRVSGGCCPSPPGFPPFTTPLGAHSNHSRDDPRSEFLEPV